VGFDWLVGFSFHSGYQVIFALEWSPLESNVMCLLSAQRIFWELKNIRSVNHQRNNISFDQVYI
jgi:hypothetical protein